MNFTRKCFPCETDPSEEIPDSSDSVEASTPASVMEALVNDADFPVAAE